MKYSTELKVDKSVNEVFDHLIDLAKWWPEEFEGGSLGLNTEFILKTGDGHYSKNKIVEFVRNKKVVWLITESLRKTDNFDWTGTKMIFELTSHGSNTHIKFTYDGVVLENEADRLVHICDLTLKEIFYNSIKSFRTTIRVAKSPESVFKSVTHDVAKWWGGPDLTGNTSQLYDEFIINHPGAHYSKQRLVEVIPDKKVIWLVTESTLSWLQKDQSEWQNTKMIFELITDGVQTTLHFMHEGLVPEKECFSLCSQGWTTIIKDYLFHLINEGKPHF